MSMNSRARLISFNQGQFYNWIYGNFPHLRGTYMSGDSLILLGNYHNCPFSCEEIRTLLKEYQYTGGLMIER